MAMFKKAVIYKITGDIPRSIEQYIAFANANKVNLDAKSRSIGCDFAFYPKLGQRVYSVSQCLLMSFVVVEKKIPNKLFQKLVAEQIRKKENESGESINSKERNAIKDAISIQLLSKTHASVKDVNIFIDMENNLFVADCSYKLAEDILAMFRRAFGSFQVEVALEAHKVSICIFKWFQGIDVPKTIELGFKAKLQASEKNGPAASFSNDELLTQEIQVHGNSKTVKKIEIIYNSLIKTEVNDDCSLSAIKPCVDLGEHLTGYEEDYVGLLEAEFCLMRDFIIGLLKELS